MRKKSLVEAIGDAVMTQQVAAPAPKAAPAGTHMIEAPTSEHRLRVVARKLGNAHDNIKAQLAGRLRSLSYEIARARKAVDAGEDIDPLLIANAAGIDGLIARWNFTIEYAPYVAEESVKRVFNVGDFYGSIRKTASEFWTVHGWASFLRPVVGDRFIADMVSGRTAIFEITEIRWQHDPPDMFFATVKGLCYVDELGREGAAS